MSTLLRVASLCALAFMVACSTAEDPVSVDTSEKDQGEISVTGITLTTTAAKYLTSVSATTGGTVTSTKNIKERGVCYGTSTKPTIANGVVVSGSGTGTFESVITGLASNTKYYVRTYVKYGADLKVAYGPQVSFTTLTSYGTMTDNDGNEYATVTIGNQVWMAENLRTTKYRDGSEIPNVTDATDWSALTTGAWCSYDNSADNAAAYGHLYNWYAVGDTRNIAPEGWHVPSYTEWTTLEKYFGSSNEAGGYLKETGTDHWASPNTGATNGAGFNARGSGSRMYAITTGASYFRALTQGSPWWLSTGSETSKNFKSCQYNDTRSYQSVFLGGLGWYHPKTGYAVRLIKD